MSKVYSIPTVYNGYKCRSLAEARWMKLLDEAGVNYAYESEGFKLSDGTKYLPDFYLPRQDCFFEVKGVMDGKDLHKIRQLAIDSGKEVFVGYPDFSMELYSVNGEREALDVDPVNGILESEDTGPLPAEPESDIFICECKECLGVYMKSKLGDWTCPICGYYDGDNGFHIVYDTTYPGGDAYEAAKSLSFEDLADEKITQKHQRGRKRVDVMTRLQECIEFEKSHGDMMRQRRIDAAFADESVAKEIWVHGESNRDKFKSILEQAILNGYWSVLTCDGELNDSPEIHFLHYYHDEKGRLHYRSVIKPHRMIRGYIAQKGKGYVVLSKALENHINDIYKMLCENDPMHVVML